jgi:hypothetical protein
MAARERPFLGAPINRRRAERGDLDCLSVGPAARAGLSTAADEREPNDYRKRELERVPTSELSL